MRTIVRIWFFVFTVWACARGQMHSTASSVDNMDRARAILQGGFESKDYSIRIQAITAGGMVGSKEGLVTRMQEFLQDKNADVRVATVHALADLHCGVKNY